MLSANHDPAALSLPDAPAIEAVSPDRNDVPRQNWLLTSILSASSEEMYVLDREGRFLFVNQPGARALGKESSEIVGKTGLEIGAPPEIVAQFDREREIVFATGAPLAGTAVYPTPQGPRHYDYLWTPLNAEAGTAPALLFAARDVTERKRDELAREFLTRASVVFASSLDYEQTLQQVADLAVPHIADWCGVDMLEADGSISQLAVAHIDPAKIVWARELRRQYPPNPEAMSGLPNIMRTGKSELYPYISDEMLVASARDAQHLEMARNLSLRSVMIVPMLGRERVLGAITFVTTRESGHDYSQTDLALAEGLAARAALAIENARLYRLAQDELAERRRALDALVEHQAVIETLNVRLQRSMRETHHRVKNNLQVVSALLDMQEMQYAETVPIAEIARLRQHIQALSAIHDLLTHQARTDVDVSDLSVREAMERLIPTIQSLVTGRPIEFAVEDLRMPVRHVTTLTVLVNELVSNAIKHGQGRIRLEFAVRENRAILEVRDNGPGFPNRFDAATAANTGLELVQTLAHLDLQGETRFGNHGGGGGQAVVEFPIPKSVRTAGEE